MQHFLKGDNVGLICARQSTESYWSLIQVTNTIIDNVVSYKYGSNIYDWYIMHATMQDVNKNYAERIPNIILIKFNLVS